MGAGGALYTRLDEAGQLQADTMHESKETIVIVWEFRAGSSCHSSSLPRDHHAELLYAGGVALSRYEEQSSICYMCLFLKRF